MLKLSAAFAFKFLTFSLIVIVFKTTSVCSKQLHNFRVPKPKVNFISLTSLRCLNENQKYVKFTRCTLKALNRTNKYGQVHGFLKRSIDRPVMVHFNVLKKGTGGYKPFVINAIFEGCQYLDGKRNPVIDWMYKLIFPYSNVNHSCPYKGEVIFNVPIRQVNLSTPFPEGEYRNVLTFHRLGELLGEINGDVAVKEVEQFD